MMNLHPRDSDFGTKVAAVKSYVRNPDFRNKIALTIVVLGLWQLSSQFFPHYIFPGIYETFEATHRAIVDPQFGTYHGNLFDTFRRLLVGFIIAVLIGGSLGTLMGLRREVEVFFQPWLIFGLSLPAMAVAFALVIIVGISEWVPILTVILVGIPFVMLNMWEGTQDLDQEIDEMATFFGANQSQRIKHILLPQLLQYLFPSMYWGFVVSWKVLFIAEVFGAGSGLGYMVNYWYDQQRVDMIFGWVIMPVLLVILAQESLRYTEHRLMDWR